MPNLDRTGPDGKGPKTGRGLGPCSVPNQKNEKTIDSPSTTRRGGGRRLGRGR